jgi:alpha-galactosidase
MLEVGRVSVNGKMNVGWNRAHFGAWCVVSAPLILGMDLTQQPELSAVVDIITNAEAIAVSL